MHIEFKYNFSANTCTGKLVKAAQAPKRKRIKKIMQQEAYTSQLHKYSKNPHIRT